MNNWNQYLIIEIIWAYFDIHYKFITKRFHSFESMNKMYYIKLTDNMIFRYLWISAIF